MELIDIVIGCDSADQAVAYRLVRLQMTAVVRKACFGLKVKVYSSALALYSNILLLLFPSPRSGELRTQKLKSHLVRTQSLNALPLKPGVGQYMAIHATFTAMGFFLAYIYPSSPFTCIYSKTSPDFFSCVGCG